MTIAADVLEVDGAFNARVFVSTRTGRPWLLRSSALDALTPSGVETLHELGIRRVVDLREPGEGAAASHDIDLVAVPVYRFDDGVPAVGRLEDLMERVIETRGEVLAEIVTAIAQSEGPVAVHCTIGKDRTGLVVALALLVAGATERDVVADYVRSGAEVLPHRRDLVERMLADRTLTPRESAEAWRLNVESPPEVMRHIAALLDRRGGAASYLRAHGMPDDAAERLRARL